MTRYVLRRLVISLIVLLAVLFLAYALIYHLPENYAEIVAREMSMIDGSGRSADEWESILMSEYGLDSGLFNGFFTWLTNSFKGNFGTSWYYGVSVTEKFYPSFLNSITLGLISSFCSLTVAISLGIYTASGKKRKVGRIISLITVVFISIPLFFIVALLKYVFSIKLGWFDLGGMNSFDSIGLTSYEYFFDRLSHMVLPVLAMVIASVGTLARYVHINIKGLVGSRYLKGLRAKGLSERKIISEHLLRNATVPVINVFCTMLPTVLAGSMVVETLFSIDGIGHLAYSSLMNGDIPMIMFYVLYTTVLTVGFSFISDVLCAAVDYRVADSLRGRE